MNFQTTIDRGNVSLTATVVYGVDFDQEVPDIVVGSVLVDGRTIKPSQIPEDELQRMQDEAWEHFVDYSRAIRELTT